MTLTADEKKLISDVIRTTVGYEKDFSFVQNRNLVPSALFLLGWEEGVHYEIKTHKSKGTNVGHQLVVFESSTLSEQQCEQARSYIYDQNRYVAERESEEARIDRAQRQSERQGKLVEAGLPQLKFLGNIEKAEEYKEPHPSTLKALTLVPHSEASTFAVQQAAVMPLSMRQQ